MPTRDIPSRYPLGVLTGYSITSSARASTIAGTSRPSALAVLRVGCMLGGEATGVAAPTVTAQLPNLPRAKCDLARGSDRSRIQLVRKQYNIPAPPDDFSWSWLHPREPCEEFQEFMCRVSLRPARS